MVIIFAEEMVMEKVEELIEQIEESGDDTIDMYFSSGGGDTACADILTHYFNEIKFRYINLYLTGMVESCAMTFVLTITNPRVNIVCLDTANGMIHHVKMLIAGRDIKKAILNPNKKSLCSCIDEENVNLYKTYEDAGIPKKYMDEMKQGKNSYIPNSELKKIIEFSQNRYKNKEVEQKKTKKYIKG